MTVRISITLPDELVDRLKLHANIFAQGAEEENVSKVISNLIEKHIPYAVAPLE